VQPRVRTSPPVLRSLITLGVEFRMGSKTSGNDAADYSTRLVQVSDFIVPPFDMENREGIVYQWRNLSI
jgi:hypothetical protein